MTEVYKQIRRIQIKTTKEVNNVFAGAYHSVFKGRGLEFEDARAYLPGDDERSIDWNVTARMNYPYVKNYREERELTVMLIVDISASGRFSSTSQLKSDIIAELSAVLAFSAIKNHDKVGLLLFSSDIELYIPPKRGQRHVLRLIREILVFTPKKKGTDVRSALTFLGKVQRKTAACFLISDFICEDFHKQASLIAKRHDLIGISVNDPFEKAFPPIGLVNIRDLESGEDTIVDASHPSVQDAYREETSKRIQSHKASMNKIGASFIQVRTDEPYVEVLHKFFKRRRRRL